jgi:hypothetical protein
MERLTKRLSVMKGFTKEYWGLRGSLAALFKMCTPVKVTNLETYMRSKSEILGTIRTKLAYENGGVFRPEEIAYLGEKYASVKSAVNEFVAGLDHPTEDLAQNFDRLFAPIKTRIEQCDREVRVVSANRAKILFPIDKKKRSLKFKKLSLAEKLSEIPSEKEIEFTPESLPGISVLSTSQAKWSSLKWKQEVYGSLYSESPTVKEVIDSWYANFASSEDDA